MPPAVPDSAALVVDGVSKAFRVPRDRVVTLKERALHPLRGTRYDTFEALADVSFEVERGEWLGIVGRNGGGKSTLLKCIAGIYGTDAGRIMLRGTLSPFIELGVGFNPNLRARDNVTINAIMLGLPPDEARARFDSVIEFAGLEEFVELKLKNYSSGMHVRLAFAVMVQVDADVLLIDEVLAVGDAAFQQKCYDTLQAKREEGCTVLFVTHDMHTVERTCDRALLLERGRIVEIGDPTAVAREYNRLNFAGAADRAAAADGEGGHGSRAGDGTATIVDAWFEDDGGERAATLFQGRRCSFHSLVEIRQDVVDPVLGFVLMDDHHRRVFATTTTWQRKQTGSFATGDRVELKVEFDNWLSGGKYLASPFVSHSGVGAEVMDERHDLVAVAIIGSHEGGGVVDLPHDVDVRRVTAGAPAQVAPAGDGGQP
jgi:ABC-type polysaccharide/polyol phosphate transport system ATPase subunit